MTYLLSTLHAAGLTVSLRDGRLVVGPSALLTDELRQAIREGREELLQAVRLRDLDAHGKRCRVTKTVLRPVGGFHGGGGEMECKREGCEVTWTRELPGETGYFWWRHLTQGYAPRVLYVSGGKMASFSGQIRKYLLEELGGEWCGPLPIPEDKP